MPKNITLADISKQFVSLAKLYIQTAPTRAIDTGYLRDSIKAVKRVSQQVPGKVIFDLDTVYYGYFVENGTKYMKPRPFAKRAADSDVLKSMIDEYFKKEVELTLMKYQKSTSKKLKKYIK